MKEQVIVMGGGVIGLSCAFELRKRGHEVTVMETSRCGGQASGAAAGMLAPYSENVEGPDAFFQLGLESLQLYPEWQAAVKLASGHSFEYTNSGSLYAVFHDADLLAFEGRQLWQCRHGASSRIVEGGELQRLEPNLASNVRAALYTPEESHLYAPHYVKALEQGCRLMGVEIIEQLEQLAVTEWQSEIRVRAADGRIFSGDRLVVCSGAWAKELEETFGIRIPVYPIRGQICAYEADALPVRHMVFSSQGYLVAKENGTLVCGASEDVAGFDTSVTDKGIERLRKWNRRLFPELEHRDPFHRWAGLRPSTQDGFPLLGPLSSSDRVIMAAGHYRNGILLSPATARFVADCLDEKQTVECKKAFSPERFGYL
ncbi:glycine oxidase [Paenibacillus taihuensis]|uniref:glycine oxidase n=1 Tax=Paenibacillus taihuensis TaxID=1156355 RepID=A0A3D9R5E0_9BACL|nr:glycine oxidase ThiO [Paenibacillus taihuensis]REE69629.1 glycine oxidase [Paenibacillus taihuensis]